MYSITSIYTQQYTNLLLLCNPSQHTISGQNRATSETPFEWRFVGGSIVTCFYMLTADSHRVGGNRKRINNRRTWIQN